MDYLSRLLKYQTQSIEEKVPVNEYSSIYLEEDTYSWMSGKNITYDTFLNDITQLDKVCELTKQTSKLKVHIKTKGNDISNYLAIANVISQYKEETVAVIDRFALSGGTLLCLLCDRIEMKEHALLGRISAYNYMPFNSTHIIKAQEAVDMSWTKVIFEYLIDMEKCVVDQFKKMLLRKYTAEEVDEIIQFFIYGGSHNVPIYYDQLPEVIKKKVTIIKMEQKPNRHLYDTSILVGLHPQQANNSSKISDDMSISSETPPASPSMPPLEEAQSLSPNS